MIWSESSVRRIVLEVLQEQVEQLRGIVLEVLQEQVEKQLRTESRPAIIERIADDAKATLHRKLNAIYAAHAERLNQRIADLERQLEASTPEHQRRLEEFESRLQEVVTTYRNRLNEPERDLLSMILQHKEEFAQEIKDMAANSMAQIRGAAQQTERRVEKMIEDRLHNLILEAVHEHVRSAPLERDGLSNKQLATAKGISLRAAKRLRRAGLASPAIFRMARSG